MSSQTYKKDINDVNEFYMFLTSEPDIKNGFGKNKPGSFTNHLQTPMNFTDPKENWQVALESLEIPNAIYNLTGSLCEFTYRNLRLAPYKDDQDITLFNDASFEPLIDRVLKIPPGYYDPWTYCDAVNHAFEELIDTEIKKRLDEAFHILSKEKNYWDHHVSTLEERPLTETETVQDDVKKSKLDTSHNVGLSIATIHDKNEIPFPEKDSQEFLSFWSTTLTKYKEQQMRIKNGLAPVSAVTTGSKHKLSDDIISLAVPELLRKSDFHLTFKYEISPSKTFLINLEPSKEKIFFSEDNKLHEVLGFKNKILEEGLNQSNIVTTLNKHHGLLFVYCSLVDYTAVSAQNVPLIRLFNITDLLRATNVKIDSIAGHENMGWGSAQHHVNHLDYINLNIDRLHYYPVHSTLIKNISIDLCNADGYIFQFEKTFLNTVVTLHFRRKPKYTLVEYS